MVFEIGMQMSARHAPCGFTSNPFTRGRSRLLIHNDDALAGSRRIVVKGVARSPNSTVAAIGFGVDAFAIHGWVVAAPMIWRKKRRFIESISGPASRP